MFRYFRRFATWSRLAALTILPLCTSGIAIAGENDVVAESSASTEVVPETARQFVAETCTHCHNAKRNTANLNLTSLAYDPDDRGSFALWVKVHDRVSAGEMPPEDAKQPEPGTREAFVSQLAQTFIKSESRQMAGEGRATRRRMNRFEFENALRDLLGVPTAQLAVQLPPDG